MRLWQHLLAGEPGAEQDPVVAWPGTGKQVLDIETRDMLASYARSMADHVEREPQGPLLQLQGMLPSAEGASSAALSAPPIRFLPTTE